MRVGHVAYSPNLRFTRVFFSLVVLTLFTGQGIGGQEPSAPPSPSQWPIPAQPDAADREQILAYWTTETGWNSELQLRNNAIDEDLTVTPALRLADGAETSLAPVTIKPQEVKSVDIDAAVAAASAPQFVGTFGSVVLRYRSPSLPILYASLMVHRMGHPIAFHIDAVAESMEFQAGSREGVWWLPKDTTNDYLVLTNQGGEPYSTRPIPLRFHWKRKQAEPSPRPRPNQSVFRAQAGPSRRFSRLLWRHQSFRRCARGFAGHAALPL